MPYRPIQHRNSDRAVSRVREIWASIGAATEEIRKDYGEDLLVQTCFKGKMDASRIWVQVKGVQSAPEMEKPRGQSRVRVRADLALRWARTADILVLVLWDVSRDIGWYSIPQLHQLHSELAEKDRQEIPLIISSKDVFDSRSVETVAWEGRLTHLEGFVRNFRMMQQEEAEREPGKVLWADQAVYEAILDMMIDLGMIEKAVREKRAWVVSAEFKDTFFEMLMEMVPGIIEEMSIPTNDQLDEIFKRASIRSLIKWISNATECGTSITLVMEMLPILGIALDFKGLRKSYRLNE